LFNLSFIFGFDLSTNYSEILITDEPDYTVFQNLAERIISEFGAKLIEKINDLDSVYLDFLVNNDIITFHLNTFSGISIFPKDLDKASFAANQLAEKIGLRLKYANGGERSWVIFKSGVEVEIQFLWELIVDARQEKEKYHLKKYSESKQEMKEHLDCAICLESISGDDFGYFADIRMLCTDCFNAYIAKDDYLNKIEKMDKIVKISPHIK
jgi:hypothetical protein